MRMHQRGKHKSDIKNKITIAKISTRNTNNQHIHTLIFFTSSFLCFVFDSPLSKKKQKKNT
jgi:hypothetical protein